MASDVIEGEVDQLKDLDGVLELFHRTANALDRMAASHQAEERTHLRRARLRWPKIPAAHRVEIYGRAADHSEIAETLLGEAGRWRDAATAVREAFDRRRPTPFPLPRADRGDR